jgi:hypothetical protein
LVSGLESVTGIVAYGIIALITKTGALDLLSKQSIGNIEFFKPVLNNIPSTLETIFNFVTSIGGIGGIIATFNLLTNQLFSLTSSIRVFQKINKLLYVTVNYQQGQPYFGNKRNEDQTMQEMVYWISAVVKPVFSIILTEYLLSAQLNQLSEYSKIGATIIPTSITNIVRFIYKISVFYFNAFYFSPIHFQFNDGKSFFNIHIAYAIEIDKNKIQIVLI